MSHNNKTKFTITAAPTIGASIGTGLTEDFKITAMRRNLSLCGALKEAVFEYVEKYRALPRRPDAESSAEQLDGDADGQSRDGQDGEKDGEIAPTPSGGVRVVGSEKAADNPVEEAVAGSIHAARIMPQTPCGREDGLPLPPHPQEPRTRHRRF